MPPFVFFPVPVSKTERQCVVSARTCAASQRPSGYPCHSSAFRVTTAEAAPVVPLLIFCLLPLLPPTALLRCVFLPATCVSALEFAAAGAKVRRKARQIPPPPEHSCRGDRIETISKYTSGGSVPNVNVTLLSQRMQQHGVMR